MNPSLIKIIDKKDIHGLLIITNVADKIRDISLKQVFQYIVNGLMIISGLIGMVFLIPTIIKKNRNQDFEAFIQSSALEGFEGVIRIGFVDLDDILAITSEVTGCSIDDMKSIKKTRELVYARELYALSARIIKNTMEFDYSLGEIGNEIIRDHSLVSYYYKKYDGRKNIDNRLKTRHNIKVDKDIIRVLEIIKQKSHEVNKDN